MIVWLLLFVVFTASLGGTFLLRRYALAKSLIDIPNERSSHVIPTPRGGGVAIVIAFLVTIPLLATLNLLSTAALFGLFGSGLIVALIGFADDHGHIAARWRLLGHFLAAAWAIFWLGGIHEVNFFGVAVQLGWLGTIWTALYLVWMLNLYNFMDGIDALASAQAICVCVSICIVYWLGGETDLIWAPLVLAAAVLGFLCWNFPPAKIFMGDAGSGFLGVVLASLSVQSAAQTTEFLWSWLILMGVFIVDATFTLMCRLMTGHKVYEAHRSHAYQKAAMKFGRHGVVTFSVIAINVFWLLPIAVLSVGSDYGSIYLILAYAPLIWLAFRLKAGSDRV
ncbi:MraY family glycosyltransferase [Pseudomonas sp. TNT2022 ID642]|uniref:MraY family glycosyltransferase n=1 Tax=Pseudomonas sp. TNT2022 ID642 TaxID=2942632 RepID=UPI00235FE1F8|nr:glycosyltransferase family 4 protein [Pseudomonas sp. TNT2022 ID642]MDD1005307.1 glycosyltransferase family 4 protein [Pseudomonas sp. TNT2022 ID642]